MPVDLVHDEAKSIDLDLGHEAVIVKKSGKTEEVIRNLSGAAFIGDSVYLANDEGRRLLQLRRTALNRYEFVAAPKMATLFDIESDTDKDGEFDLEALAVDRIDANRVRLWLIGSHAMGHAKPNALSIKQQGLKRERNRLLFGCVDIGPTGPIEGGGRHLRIRQLGKTHTTDFLSALRDAPPAASGFLHELSALVNLKDEAANPGWFTPYTLASTKENGLDIEGLAIRRRDGDAYKVVAFVGLRGPVIAGLAVLVEIEIHDHDSRTLRIAGTPRFHLLDLKGFGVRDLEWRGDDLLILAGPTMTRQKESSLFRWNDAWHEVATNGEAGVVEVPVIEHIGCLPMPQDQGGPEVIATIAPGEPEYMVLRDGIRDWRLRDKAGNASALGPVYHAEVYRIADR